jgi:hypothetical protein
MIPLCWGPHEMRQFEPGQDRKVAALRAPSHVMSHLQLFFFPKS